MISVADVVARLLAAERIVLTTHARADGDAIGCVATMQRVLRQQGKQVTGYLHECPTERYTFLRELEPLSIWQPDQAGRILADADLFVLLDTCASVQIEAVAASVRAASLKRIAVDHHVTRDDIVDEIFTDTSAGACAQLVMRLCDAAGWPLDKNSAVLLYCGLATDTGWFRFSNADAAAYADAARLIERGAAPNELYEQLYLNETPVRARLMGEVMSGFELVAGGKLAVVRLSREALIRCGATPQMTEDLINEPQRIGSVVACVLLVEPLDDDPIKVSFRSKRDVDVAKVASRFGGGGHARAAGAKVSGTLKEVAARVVAEMMQALGG